jgi:hypothetical protein
MRAHYSREGVVSTFRREKSYIAQRVLYGNFSIVLSYQPYTSRKQNGTAKDKWKSCKESRKGTEEHLKGWKEEEAQA